MNYILKRSPAVPAYICFDNYMWKPYLSESLAIAANRWHLRQDGGAIFITQGYPMISYDTFVLSSYQFFFDIFCPHCLSIFGVYQNRYSYKDLVKKKVNIT